MGKASKRNALVRQQDEHAPRVGDLLPGSIHPKTQAVTIPRRANFWRELPGRRVECSLCYRQCVLKPGEVGWCRYRRNDGGRMVLLDHGTVARQMPLSLGYGGGCWTYLPGARALGIGGVKCTARCSFCTSADITWSPDRIPWHRNTERAVGHDGVWYLLEKAVLHPASAIAIARQRGARAIVFSENEPLLSFEFTYDVARLARAAGLGVLVYSNGFATPEAIAAIAPYVDAVDLGVKGSLDEGFYTRWMRSPGGPEAVRRSLLAWRDAGIEHLMISDLIATHHQQDDDVQEEASARFYDWVAANLGPHIPIMVGRMHVPDGQKRPATDWLLPQRPGEIARYRERLVAGAERARAAGLHYAHVNDEHTRLTCHQCGELLLTRHAPPGGVCPRGDACTLFTDGCDCWSHTQHVTDRRCDHCGADVPIVTLPREELARAA